MKKEINYSDLDPSDFDCIVTGELINISIFLELQINNFLSYYFTHGSSRKADFRTFFLHGPYLGFQDKIDITRSIVAKYYPKLNKQEAVSILNQVESFKSLRNTFAHGFSSLDKKSSNSELIIEITTRTGKIKKVAITPENHKHKMTEYKKLMKDFTIWRLKTIQTINRKKV